MNHFWVIKDTQESANYGSLLTSMDNRSVLTFNIKADAFDYIHGLFSRREWSRYKPIKAWITTRNPNGGE